jgi:hypothetical protein
MTFEELQKRYQRLVQLVGKMRGHQREYFKYRASYDLERARRLEREVDKIIREEEQRKNSHQPEIF